MPDELNRDDEIVEVKLPRGDYEVLRDVLEREKTYSYISRRLKSTWVWVVAGGILSLFALWNLIFDGQILLKGFK